MAFRGDDNQGRDLCNSFLYRRLRDCLLNIVNDVRHLFVYVAQMINDDPIKPSVVNQ
jgi:hypothetical protein